jgi:peroxiredoxin
MSIQIGQKAPDFILFSSEKTEVKLSAFEGQKVLLLFFPFAFTSTCTRELCGVRDDLTFYNATNAVVFAISVDSLYTLAKYKEEQRLNFSLLSDFNKEISAQYNALYELFGFGMRGVSKRAAFVIDEKGILRYIEILEDAGQIPDFQKIRSYLEQLS